MLRYVSPCSMLLQSDPYSFEVTRYDSRCSGCDRLLPQCSACDQRLRCSRSAGQCFTRCLVQRGFLKICSKFTREHPHRSVISIKLQSNFIEITLRHRCSLVNLLHIFRTPFLKKHIWLFASWSLGICSVRKMLIPSTQILKWVSSIINFLRFEESHIL